MTRALACSVAAAFAIAARAGLEPAAARPAAPLVLEATIALDHVSGRIDHMAVDLRRRLIVAELGNNTVDLIDLAAGRAAHRITGLHEPQGVGYVEQADLIVIANAGDGSVQFFRGGDFGRVGSLSLGDDADNVRIDPRSGNVLVGYGKGGLAVIDLNRRAVVANIKLPAHPEGFRIAWDTGMAYVILPDARQIAVVDLNGKRVANVWHPGRARSNFPMALGQDGRRVAVVFRSPSRLMLFDTTDGNAVADVATCGDADDVFFDGRRHRIYVSCGSGQIATFEQSGDGLHALPPVQTFSGARTSLFVPEFDRLFVARRAGMLGGHAAILVYRPG